jgi:hypothetical protein
MAIVNAEIPINELPVKEQAVIGLIRKRNSDIASGNIVPDQTYWGGAVSLGFEGIRSSHGVGFVQITTRNVNFVTLYKKRGSIGDLYRWDTLTRKKVKLCWMVYAESFATEHSGGEIPTLVEFSGSGSGGGRIILEYARDFVLYTPDHYGTYYLVTQGGAPARTM